jgi:hypothetical protein
MFSVCPLKGVIGDQKQADAPPAKPQAKGAGKPGK